MKRLAFIAMIAAILVASGCSLRQTKVIDVPNPSGTKTVIVHLPQALDWNVTWSSRAATTVRLGYPLCPGQKLVGQPRVHQNAQNVSITLLATQPTCANPVTKHITIQLGKALGNRALTNPALLN